MPEPQSFDPNGVGTPEPVSNFQLKFSYWYVTHKFQLRKVGVASLIVLNVALFGYSGYSAYRQLFVEQAAYQRLLGTSTADYVNYQAFRQANAANDIELTGFSALPVRDNQYDIWVKLQNPNDQYVGTVELTFYSGGEVIAERTVVVLPEEERYAAAFAVPLPTGVSPEVELTRVRWQRVADFASIRDERLRFAIRDIKFSTPEDLGLVQDTPISSASFTVRNDSAYSYWRVGFYVILHSGDSIAGINYIALDQFKSGEERVVEVRWSERLAPVSAVEVVPEVNIVDQNSFMPVE